MRKLIFALAIAAGIVGPTIHANARPYCWLDHYNNIRCSGF